VKEHRGGSYRQIIIVSIVLAILTAVEYFVALAYPSAVFLLLIALVKAAVIVQFFMHIYRLWREESH
jgi:cytochrome c oxidase subunit IV